MNATHELDECEEPLPRNNGEKTRRIDLGLAIVSNIAPPGATFTPDEIASFCGCSAAMISAIEARALRKLRRKMRKQFSLSPFELKEFPFLNRHFKR